MKPPPINRQRPVDTFDRLLAVAMVLGVSAVVTLLMLGCASPKRMPAPVVSDSVRAMAESFAAVESSDPPLPKHNLAEPLSLYYRCTNAKSCGIRVINVIENGRQVVFLRVLTRVPDGSGWTDAAYGYTLECRDFREGIGARFEHIDPEPGEPTKPGLTVVGLSPDAREVQIQFDHIEGFVHEFRLKGTSSE